MSILTSKTIFRKPMDTFDRVLLKNVSTFIFRILLCLTGYAAGVWSEAEKASRNFHRRQQNTSGMGCISLVLAKMGIGGGSPRVLGETQMRVPRKKDSIAQQWSFCLFPQFWCRIYLLQTTRTTRRLFTWQRKTPETSSSFP